MNKFAQIIKQPSAGGLLKLFIGQAAGRQVNAEAGQFVCAAGSNFAAVQVGNFLRDSQTKACAAGVGGPGAVQPEKFLKNTFQLLRPNSLALVQKADFQTVVSGCRLDTYWRIRVAVCDGVFQNVIEYARHFVGVGINLQILRRFQRNRVAVALQQWIKFVRQLHQQIMQVDGFPA